MISRKCSKLTGGHTTQAREVLHKLLIQTCGEMHAARREALETMVWAGLTSQRMTVTGLGRAIGGVAREKHNIKRADRLLSNAHLQSEREAMYGVLAHRLVGSQRQPVLLVDWSDLDEWRRNQVLRVSLAVEGRALTVYEEVHGRKTAVKPKTHVQFLHRLQAVLPVGCRPILVTDAGFKTPWFQAVEASGWYWVSRVRERRYVKLGSESDRFGLALEFHRSRDPQRLAILLLILALALLVLWLIGSIAKERGLMRHYQANTVGHREVLSVIFLGLRIIERAQDHFTAAELCIAWQSIPLRNARVPNLAS